MGKQKKSLDEDMDDVFANWAVGPKARQNFELYQPDKEEDSNTPASSTEQEQEESIVEDQKPSAKNTPSTSSPPGRIFKDRPGEPKDKGFTPTDISKEDFFSYYGTLFDVVVPQLHPYSGLILSVLFQQSYGSGRNWCQMSFSEIARMINVSRNTVRTYLKPLIKNGWVCILSDGYREATTYGVWIPHEADRV